MYGTLACCAPCVAHLPASLPSRPLLPTPVSCACLCLCLCLCSVSLSVRARARACAALGWAGPLQRGRTALHKAAIDGHAGVVSALIEGKAALDVRRKVGDVFLFARSLTGRQS